VVHRPSLLIDKAGSSSTTGKRNAMQQQAHQPTTTNMRGRYARAAENVVCQEDCRIP
jgi:hypothetical protein